MAEETNPSTDPSEVELAAEESAENVSDTAPESTPAVESLTLEELNKLAGREFSSKEDFAKHYGNLKSFVGKRVPVKPAQATTSETQESAEKLADVFVTRDELAKRDFIASHPEAKDIADDIFTVATVEGVIPEELYQKRYRPLVEAKAAREKAEAEEKALWKAYQDKGDEIQKLMNDRRYAEAAGLYYKAFAQPVHSFFEKVFVNVEDEGVRNNRLTLLKKINELYSQGLAELSQIVMPEHG